MADVENNFTSFFGERDGVHTQVQAFVEHFAQILLERTNLETDKCL